MTIQELTVKISADTGDIKKKFDEIGAQTQKTTSNMMSQFKNLAGVIGVAFSVVAIVKFAKACESAFADMEMSIITLDNTLKNIGVSDTQIAQIETFIDDLEGASKFDDTQIRNAMKDLTIKFGSADVAMKILTVSMQASRNSGEDLATTVQKISLGLLGNTKGLKDYGIQVTDSMTKQEVLDTIMKKTTGSMDKFMNSTKGASADLAVSFDKLKEEIGSKLAPIVSGFNEGLAKEIALMFGASVSSKEYQASANRLGTVLAAVFGGTLGLVGSLGTALIDLGEVFNHVWDFGYEGQQARANFAEDLKNIGDIWKGTGDILNGVNQETGKSFDELMAEIEKVFGSTNAFLSKGVKETADTIAAEAEKAAKVAEEAAKKAAEEIIRQEEKIHEKVKEYTEKSADLKTKLTELVRNQTELERDSRISAIEKERDVTLSAIQDEMDARYDQYLSEIGLIDTEANSQISVLQKQLKQMADGREKQQHDNWLSEKRGEIARAKTSEERAKIQKEIDKELGNWQYENSRNGIQNQIELIRSQAEEDKKLAQDEYDADKKVLDQKLKNWTENYDLLLTNAKDYYANLLLERNAELKAEQLLVSNNMEDVLKMLKDTESKWALLGTTIGDAFWGNLMGAIGDIKDLKNILSLAANLPGGGGLVPPEFAGGFQGGGSFIASRPTMFMAGEAGTERVSITPQGKDESIPLLRDLLKEMRKFNEFTAKQLGRDISLGISGLGGKV